jgi:hypothetical protein
MLRRPSENNVCCATGQHGYAGGAGAEVKQTRLRSFNAIGKGASDFWWQKDQQIVSTEFNSENIKMR